MSIKFARTTATLTCTCHHGARIAQDDPWNGDDPLVKAHPEHFADRPLRLFGERGADVDVEQATAAPGEKRTTRRPK